MDEVKSEVTMGVITKIAYEMSGFSFYMITDKQWNGYNIVKLESTPYTVWNENKEKMKQGELITNASVLATVDRRINWYNSTTENTIFQLHNVVHPNIKSKNIQKG